MHARIAPHRISRVGKAIERSPRQAQQRKPQQRRNDRITQVLGQRLDGRFAHTGFIQPLHVAADQMRQLVPPCLQPLPQRRFHLRHQVAQHAPGKQRFQAQRQQRHGQPDGQLTQRPLHAPGQRCGHGSAQQPGQRPQPELATGIPDRRGATGFRQTNSCTFGDSGRILMPAPLRRRHIHNDRWRDPLARPLQILPHPHHRMQANGRFAKDHIQPEGQQRHGGRCPGSKLEHDVQASAKRPYPSLPSSAGGLRRDFETSGSGSGSASFCRI